jgi:hypothetical protein
MNWEQGLTRVSAIVWISAALFGIGYTGVAMSIGEEHSVALYTLLFALAVVVPFGAHKATCWIIHGFLPTAA